MGQYIGKCFVAFFGCFVYKHSGMELLGGRTDLIERVKYKWPLTFSPCTGSFSVCREGNALFISSRMYTQDSGSLFPIHFFSGSYIATQFSKTIDYAKETKAKQNNKQSLWTQGYRGPKKTEQWKEFSCLYD